MFGFCNKKVSLGFSVATGYVHVILFDFGHMRKIALGLRKLGTQGWHISSSFLEQCFESKSNVELLVWIFLSAYIFHQYWSCQERFLSNNH
jgi:hypothetical protein